MLRRWTILREAVYLKVRCHFRRPGGGVSFLPSFTLSLFSKRPLAMSYYGKGTLDYLAEEVETVIPFQSMVAMSLKIHGHSLQVWQTQLAWWQCLWILILFLMYASSKSLQHQQ